MTRKNNKGFSLIEVIIAVAVFGILIGPLTSQLISAININKNSTKKQYAIDKAQEIMESFKTANIGASTVCIPDEFTTTTTSTESDGSTTTTTTTDNYKFELSDESPTKKTATMTVTNTDGTTSPMTVEYNVCTYTCNDISLGGAYAQYDCTVEVSDLAYIVSKQGYASKAGTTRVLDNTQMAVIASATYMSTSDVTLSSNNLDDIAYKHFREQKVDILKNNSKYKLYYNQYLSSGSDSFFTNDTMEKTTTIKVKKNGNEYTVTCEVQYEDVPFVNYYSDNPSEKVYKPTTKLGKGIVYESTFTVEADEILPIYLIYVPATVNGTYCTTDNIDVDLSALSSAAEAENLKLYLFESVGDTNISSDYKTIIENVLGTDFDSLTYQSGSSANSASSVKVYANLVNSDGTPDTSIYDSFANDSVFSNFATNGEDESNINVQDLTADTDENTYLYDITVTLTDKDSGAKTTISGTRGK